MDEFKDISQIALEILSIAEEITKKRPLNIESLYIEAKRKLNYTSSEINNAIYTLILKKIIIPAMIQTHIFLKNKEMEPHNATAILE